MILDLPYILETRRNHALEHATLHMLARTHKINMAGHSNPTGFFLFGELLTEDIRSALNEAYSASVPGKANSPFIRVAGRIWLPQRSCPGP